MFRVNQKVVCIHAPQSPIAMKWMALGAHYPTKNSVYTIRKIVLFPDLSSGVLLSELVNDHMGYSPEPAFGVEHFRPIVSRKTDIAIFTALLNPSLEDLREIVRENANV